MLEALIRKAEKLVQARAGARQLAHLSRYRDRAADYCREVLGLALTPTQQEICRLLRTPPYRVLVKAAHGVGKTFLAAALTSWWFDARRDNSAVITTAPTAREVRDLLWREVRVQRYHAGLGGFAGAQAPLLWDSHDHYAKGFTAATGESFQGRHLRHMLFVFDEAVGVDSVFWDTTRGMFQPDGAHGWLVIGNPTDTSSRMYAEELSGGWHVVQMDARDHPNLAAELRGEPPPFPAAVRLGQWEEWLRDWCDPIPADEATATDIEWPPESGKWHRPGPEMEARGLGRWPSAGTLGVWSDAAWIAATTPKPFSPRLDVMPVIGSDIARFGDDYTTIHVRHGSTSLHHERHNGWSTVRTASRLVELANEYAAWLNRLRHGYSPHMVGCEAKAIPVNVDDGGVGGGVTDLGRAQGYLFRPVLAQQQPVRPDKYDSCRSELWFSLAERARRGTLDLSRIAPEHLRRMRTQAMAPLWQQNAAGNRCVEPKAKTKERLGVGSPDDMDGVNLAYYEGGSSDPTAISEPARGLTPQVEGGWTKRNWFGRRPEGGR